MLAFAAETLAPSISPPDFVEDGGLYDSAPSAELEGNWNPGGDDAAAWELEEFPLPPEEGAAGNGAGDWWDAGGMVDIDGPDFSDFEGGASGDIGGDLGSDFGGNFGNGAIGGETSDDSNGGLNDPADIFAEPGSDRDSAEVLELLASLSYRPDRFDRVSIGAERGGAMLEKSLLPTGSKRPTGVIDESLVDIRGEGGTSLAESESIGVPRGGSELRNVSVKMESTADRFQTFELLSIEEAGGERRIEGTEATADKGEPSVSPTTEEARVRQGDLAPDGDSAKRIEGGNTEKTVEPECSAASATPETISLPEGGEADAAVALERRPSEESDLRPSWLANAAIVTVAGVLHALRVRITRKPSEPSRHGDSQAITILDPHRRRLDS